MKTRRETRVQLRQFVSVCGGQKRAAIALGVSPQFVGQLFHGLRSVPEAITARIEQRLLYGFPSSLPGSR